VCCGWKGLRSYTGARIAISPLNSPHGGNLAH
jgi:hypothetical protein